ncbi:MAG: isoprenylcysteine carboxylmethyltransferase family protein [Planctomycetota bacterium]
MKLKLRTNVRKLFILSLLVWSYPNITSLVIGGALIFVGQVIHFISSGYLVKQEQLITAGPYRFVRNPFYFANILLDAGLCIISLNIYITVAYMVIFYLGVINWRIRKEETFLSQRFGADYDAYCQKVPRIIPRLFPADIPANGSFSWAQITKHLEQWRFLRVMSLIIFFYFRLITMDSLPQVWQLTRPNIDSAYAILSQPVNIGLAAALVLIMFVPPLWVFVIKRNR